MVFIILMVLLAIAVLALAVANQEMVTVDYLFGQVELSLFAVILGAVIAGILMMVCFMIYRSIHNYVKSGSDRALKKELQQRIKTLEVENNRLENELNKLKEERERAAQKTKEELEAEKKKLEEELNRQQKERQEEAAQGQAELEAEKQRLEEELRKQQAELNKQKEEKGGTSEQDAPFSPPKKKKGFWDFLKG